MKILVIVTSSHVQKLINKKYNEQDIGLAKALNDKGYRCDVAYYGKWQYICEEYEYAPGKTFYLYLLKGIDILKNMVFFDYSDLFKKYDIIMPITYDHIETMRLAKKYPDKTVVYHGTYYAPFNKRYNFKCLIFDKIFLRVYIKNKTKFVTKNILATKYLNEKGITDVTTIGVGLDPEQLHAEENIKTPLSNLLETNKNEGIKNILYIGRLEKRRNILFLLDVFAEVKKCERNVKLILIGKGNSDYVDKCFQHAKQLGIYNEIIYRDSLEQQKLPAIYRLSDVFLLPTLYDIFGMVILEAMFFGVPVITSVNGGSRTLIKHNENGFILEDFNSAVWAEAIVSLLSDSLLKEKISTNSTKTIINGYSWDILADKFIKCFQEKVTSR